jgi:hypothetical protein
MLNLYDGDAANRMQRFIAMLRERYILEFQRPDWVNAGWHKHTVRIDGVDAFIRSGGIEFLPVDKDDMAGVYVPQSNAAPAAAPQPKSASSVTAPAVTDPKPDEPK